MNRIILVGPTCSGKSYLKNKLIKQGFKPGISYTTRKSRQDEIDGVDYNFVSLEEFERLIDRPDFFIEYTKYEGDYYGSSYDGFYHNDIFIKEVEGIKNLSPEDRKDTFIIYLNISENRRIERMVIERKWDIDKITKRLTQDNIKFKDFDDFDIEIKKFK